MFQFCIFERKQPELLSYKQEDTLTAPLTFAVQVKHHSHCDSSMHVIIKEKKENSETKAAGSRVLKESHNLPTLQPAGCSFGRLSKFHCIRLRVERKKITRATAQDKWEDRAKKYKGQTQSSSLSFSLQCGCHSASRQHLSPNMG